MTRSPATDRRMLIVDDDRAIRRTLELHFQSHGYTVKVESSVEAALQTCAAYDPDVIILDIRLGGMSGLDGLARFKAALPKTRVIMITAFHDMESTIQAMQGGADDYIHKPIDVSELNDAVTRALMYRDHADGELAIDQETLRDVDDNIMVGRSRAMKEVFKTIGMVAATNTTVLITGESGTGKELVAKAIHQASAVASGPFVAVNCAALVESLLESDMFGHEKGAFTGAVRTHPGKFAMAENGTIFLDEVGELSQSIQAKLLRVIQDKQFTPVGATRHTSSNARVLAATNRDLHQAIVEGKFREDLLYRLCVVNIPLPPLRERLDEIPILTETLLLRINKEINKRVTRVAPDVLDAFRSYPWPGNIRELHNTLMKAVALCPGEIITTKLLPEAILKSWRETPLPTDTLPSMTQSLQDVEKAQIARVLAANAWHRGRTCKVLGVSRPRLRRLIAQYGLEPPAGADRAAETGQGPDQE